MKKRVSILFTVFIFAVMGVLGQTGRAEAADYKYLIKVNRAQNCITIYTKDDKGEYTVPYKAMICSTGGANTPLGTFKTPVRYRWKILMGDVWGQYSTRIYGSILFHSVQYKQMDPSTLDTREYNRLGKGVSHGCIRLTVQDAKWIYDNCPIGTTVVIYDGKDPGPLGKPSAPIINESIHYDPTDAWTEGNPYLSKVPEININKPLIVEEGSKLDLMEGVTAAASYGGDITRYVKTDGSVDTSVPGMYEVNYFVTDLCGKKASAKLYFRVAGSE